MNTIDIQLTYRDCWWFVGKTEALDNANYKLGDLTYKVNISEENGLICESKTQD
jgi:hypothetical protein